MHAAIEEDDPQGEGSSMSESLLFFLGSSLDCLWCCCGAFKASVLLTADERPCEGTMPFI